MRTRITNIILTPGVTTEKHIPFYTDAEIQIDGNRIVYAGKREEAPAFAAEKTVDGQGNLAMPGLVNLHTHTPMTLLRSAGSDLSVNDWLRQAIWPVEKELTDESVRAGTDLGCMEMIRFGTTAFNDMYMHMDMEAESVRENGMRALLGYGIADFDGSCNDLLPAIDLLEKWKNEDTGRIRINLAPHSEPTTTPVLLEKVRDLAEQYQTSVHIHVSEAFADVGACVERHGMRPPAYLNSLGLLDRTLIAAHCVWLNEEEIALFAEKGVYIAHNPISNLKLASGIAPTAKMLASGCRLALATDGVASNNNLNLWEEMKLAPMLAKGSTLDATVFTPAQALASVTSVPAQALGFGKLGLLKEGYLADLILVNLDTPHMWPNNDLESELVYSVQGSDVTLTMVDGRILYERGRFTTMDPERVKANALQQRDYLYSKSKEGAGKWGV